jgi:hypothetical protein
MSLVLLAGCAHTDVQLIVRSFDVSECGPPTTPGIGSCFNIVIQNVGTDAGSGYCHVTYVGSPNASGGRDIGVLDITVTDLAPRATYEVDIPSNNDWSQNDGPWPCHPGRTSN